MRYSSNGKSIKSTKMFWSASKSTYLIPWNEYRCFLVRKRLLCEPDADPSSPVDHEVEPPVVSRHGVSLAVAVNTTHADADQAAIGGSDHATSYDSRAAAKNNNT